MFLLFIISLSVIFYFICQEFDRPVPPAEPHVGACPGCSQRVESGWLACPACRMLLRATCPGCGRIHDCWVSFCPWCRLPKDSQA